MASERNPPSPPAQTVEDHIDIGEAAVRGAVRVGLIRQLLISTVAAVAVIGTVWLLNVSR